MSSQNNVQIAPANGKLGVLIPGIGAVSTTFIAGVEAVRRGTAQPIGSLTQLATIRLGKRTDGRSPMIKDFVPLAGLDDLVFGGWDIYEDTAYEAAVNAGVLERTQLDSLKEPLSAIKPMTAVFDQEYVRRINGPNVKQGRTKMDKAEMLMDDIEQFRKNNDCARMVMVWCGSTEVFHRPASVHQTLKDFECGLMQNDPEIAPSQIYAYAALKSGVPYANGAPNLTTDTPALLELARERSLPICGKDFKTGQTFMKTLGRPWSEGPHAGARMAGFPPISWVTATAKCWTILVPSSPRKRPSFPRAGAHPAGQTCTRTLYKEFCHVVRINYYQAARGLQRGLGQHRYLRVAGLPDADQSRLSSAATPSWQRPSCST